jgi:hypothetical protein
MTGPARVGRPPGQAKSGGRKPGTPNRRTLAIIETLARIGCDPIEGLAQLAMDAKQPPELRFRCYAELAAYIHPKPKPIDMWTEQAPSDFHVNTVVRHSAEPLNADSEPDTRA